MASLLFRRRVVIDFQVHQRGPRQRLVGRVNEPRTKEIRLCPKSLPTVYSQPNDPSYMSPRTSHTVIDDSPPRSAFIHMESRYRMASSSSTSPPAQSHFPRIARRPDGRHLEAWDESYDPLCKSPPSRRQSTIPIPDLSTLTMGVPEMVIADAANDPAVASSPPQRRRVSVGLGRRQRRGTKEEVRVGDLGAMLVSEGVTPIEEIVGGEEREPVPGIDTQRPSLDSQRPSIGVTRPSDEDRRMRVEGWAEGGREMESPETGRRGTMSEQTVSRVNPREGTFSLTFLQDSKRKSVNFTPVATTTPIARYYNPRKESDFSTTSSASGHGSTTSNDYPLIYSPQDSPPLDARTYSGTILDLVSDPQEIREYRHLERRKEMDRRGSGNSASSSAASAPGSRSESINFGRPTEQGSARKGSLREQSTLGQHHGRIHHAHSPRARWTALGEQPFVDSIEAAMASSPSSRRSLDINTCLSPSQANSASRQHSLHASPTSPISTSPLSSGQHLFHPDLHPVADHHVPGSIRNETRDMLAELNNISQSDTALYVHSSDPPDLAGKAHQTQTVQNLGSTLTDTSSDDTSPSSSGTVRPPLAAGDGTLKAKTVADFRVTNDDLEAEE